MNDDNNFLDSNNRTYRTYVNNNNNNKNIIPIQRSVQILFELWDSSSKFADELHITWSKLVCKALLEYMINHKEDVKKPLNFTVNVLPDIEPKKEVLRCQIGDCNKVAVDAGFNLEKKKEYRLCASHSSLFHKDAQASKLWKFEEKEGSL